MYIKTDLTAEQMAKIYDVKVGTIYNWASQLRKEEENAWNWEYTKVTIYY